MGGLGLGLCIGGIEGASIPSALDNATRGSREQKMSVKAPEECTGGRGSPYGSSSSRSSTHQVPQAYTWASIFWRWRERKKLSSSWLEVIIRKFLTEWVVTPEKPCQQLHTPYG